MLALKRLNCPSADLYFGNGSVLMKVANALAAASLFLQLSEWRAFHNRTPVTVSTPSWRALVKFSFSNCSTSPPAYWSNGSRYLSKSSSPSLRMVLSAALIYSSSNYYCWAYPINLLCSASSASIFSLSALFYKSLSLRTWSASASRLSLSSSSFWRNSSS